MVRLYMDVHVHRGITAGLRARGADVLTAQEDAAGERDDPELLDRAAELGRVLFTQDQDFLREGAKRQRGGVAFSGIIFAPQSIGRIGIYVRDLEIVALASEPEEYLNRVIRLPL